MQQLFARDYYYYYYYYLPIRILWLFLFYLNRGSVWRDLRIVVSIHIACIGYHSVRRFECIRAYL